MYCVTIYMLRNAISVSPQLQEGLNKFFMFSYWHSECSRAQMSEVLKYQGKRLFLRNIILGHERVIQGGLKLAVIYSIVCGKSF